MASQIKSKRSINICALSQKNNMMRSLKKTLTIIICCALLCCYCAGVPAQTVSPPEIEFGYPEMPPRTFTNARGEPEGTHFRVARALFAKAGIAWHAAGYPALRLVKNLQDGTTNFSMLVRHPMLLDCCIYSKDPIDVEEILVYRTGDKAPVKTRAGLAGKHVIVITGYSYGGLADYLKDPLNKITPVVAASHQSAFDMLVAKRADYLLDYIGPATETLAQHEPIAGLSDEVLDSTPLYLVLSKSYPDAERVMVSLEEIYRSLDKSTQLSNYAKVARPAKNK